METQVLIIGARPTGLMLAHDLARRGVRALIVDRHAGPAEQTRAIGVQARTLEILAQAGLAAPAVAHGARTAGANLWANGEHKARVPVGDIGRDLSPYPALYVLRPDGYVAVCGGEFEETAVTRYLAQVGRFTMPAVPPPAERRAGTTA